MDCLESSKFLLNEKREEREKMREDREEISEEEGFGRGIQY